jgi:hypothetical protein
MSRLPLLIGFAMCANIASLQGCASSATPSAAELQQERLRSWQKLCDDRGFTRGTKDFDVCVMGYDREAVNPPIR